MEVLEKLKAAEISEELLSEVEDALKTLASQRDDARNEAIDNRKGAKARLTEVEQQNQTLLEKLGVESFDEAQELSGDFKGSADQLRQAETKAKRLERELQQTAERLDAEMKSKRSLKMENVVNQALSKHEFVTPDFIRSHVVQNLTWEDDDLFYKQDDGKLISVEDGVASIAKSRPETIKASGAGGAGVRQAGGQSSQQKTMLRTEFEALPVEKKMEIAKAGVHLQ